MKKLGFILCDLGATGGAEKTFSIIANHLADDYMIKVISYKYTDKCYYPLDHRIEIISLFPKNSKYRERHILLPKFFTKLRAIINGLDIIVMVSSASALGLLVTCGMKNKKIITWEQTSLGNEIYQTRKRVFCQWLSARKSNVLIQLTKKNADIAKEMFPYKHLKVDFIYNPINEVLELNNLPEKNKKRIITLARIDRVKGLELLIAVAEQVLKKHSDWQWDIYGQVSDNVYEQEIKEKLKHCTVTNRLSFHAPISDVKTELCNSSLYVMTSRYEGLPMSLLEAKSCRLPIIAFDCSTGPSEIVIDGVNGDLIPCYDIDCMANKINILIENDNKWQKYQEHAYDEIEKFMVKNIINKWKKYLILQ